MAATERWKPNVTVAAVVEHDNKFLMVEEVIDGKHVLNQPAGHLEPDESLVEAVVRETHEETACMFIPKSLVGIYRWHSESKQLTYLRVTFTGEVTDPNKSQELDSEIVEAKWMTFEEILNNLERLRSPLVLQCIKDYQHGKTYSLSLLKDLG